MVSLRWLGCVALRGDRARVSPLWKLRRRADGHVDAELVAEQTALVPGTTATVALRLAIEPGWHTYWRNPGDSGLPTTLAWKLPAGYRAGDDRMACAARAARPARWSTTATKTRCCTSCPSRCPRTRSPGRSATLAARADWLVCRETCIPEGADLSLALPVAASRAARSAMGAGRSRTRAPRCRGRSPEWSASAAASRSDDRADADAAARRVPIPGRCSSSRRTNAASSLRSRSRSPATDGRYVLTLPVASDLAPGFVRARRAC